MEKNDDFISSVEESGMENLKKEWCEHYHREEISYEQGIEENRPKEEFVDTELSSWIMGDFTIPPGGKPAESKRIRYCRVKKSDLVPVSDSECQCLKCRKRFPIEKLDRWNKGFKG